MKMIRFPFLLTGLLIGSVAVYLVMASTSIGSGFERLFQRLGIKQIPDWLPVVLGIAGLLSLTVLAWLAGFLSYGVGGGCLLVLVLFVLIPIMGGW